MQTKSMTLTLRSLNEQQYSTKPGPISNHSPSIKRIETCVVWVFKKTLTVDADMDTNSRVTTLALPELLFRQLKIKALAKLHRATDWFGL